MASGTRQHKTGEIQVSEEGRHFNATTGPLIDSKAMNVTPGPMDRFGDAPETPLRWEPESLEQVSPDMRKFARSQSEVEKDRPREIPDWIGPLVGIVTFVGVMTLGSVFLFWYFTRKPADAADDTVVEEPTELDGLPVRRNMKDLEQP